MTDTAPENPTDGEQPQPGTDDESAVIRELRAKAARADQAEERAAALERRIAMDDVGIPKTGAGKLFRDTWKGDPADLDALRTAAAEYELIATGDDGPTPQQQTEAADTAARISDTANAGGTAQPTVEALIGEATSNDEISKLMDDAGLSVPIR